MRKFIEWDFQYSVGVSEIDSQHKELMNLLNDAIDHSNGNKIDEKKYFDKIITPAEKYLKKHFETEENILSKTKYENLEEHKFEHKKFIEEIKNTHEEIENNRREMNLFKITAQIKEWLLNHINKYDKNAMEYFKEGKNIN